MKWYGTTVGSLFPLHAYMSFVYFSHRYWCCAMLRLKKEMAEAKAKAKAKASPPQRLPSPVQDEESHASMRGDNRDRSSASNGVGRGRAGAEEAVLQEQRETPNAKEEQHSKTAQERQAVRRCRTGLGRSMARTYSRGE